MQHAKYVTSFQKTYKTPPGTKLMKLNSSQCIEIELVEEIDEEHEQNDGFFITEDVDNNDDEEEEVEEIDEEHEQNDGLFFITEDVDNNNDEEEGGGGGGPNELLVATSEQEDSMGFLSTEELNKKCDEFIRKMKQGIQFEAQPIMI